MRQIDHSKGRVLAGRIEAIVENVKPSIEILAGQIRKQLDNQDFDEINPDEWRTGVGLVLYSIRETLREQFIEDKKAPERKPEGE